MASSIRDTASERAGLYGLALVAVLLAVVVGAGAGPSRAGAAELKPCESTNPTGWITTLEGELTVEPIAATRRAWKRTGVRQSLIKPANNLNGRPEFPVKKVRYGKKPRIDLKGGISLQRGKRQVKLRKLHAVVLPGKPARVRASGAGRTINFLVVRGGKRRFNAKQGLLTRNGQAQLTSAGARLLNQRLRPARKFRPGTVWGTFRLFSEFNRVFVEDPAGETPEVPPVKAVPESAKTVTGATIKWYIRDSFIDYVASGQGTRAENGATPDPPSGPKNLTYSYNFPYDAGAPSWTRPGDGGETENTLIRGTGTVGFKYCANTINFTVSDPEVEIDGDEASRIIFRVNGTDGTAFPDQRAVTVKLLPSLAEKREVTDNGDGTSTVTYTKIPGFVPTEGTGLFADLYPGYSTEFEGMSPRPDRFGHLSVSYTYATAEDS